MSDPRPTVPAREDPGSRIPSSLVPAFGPLAHAPAAAAPAAACANCDAPRVGDFCASCGQPFMDGRLTLRLIARELACRITWERGLLHTVRTMSLSPGTLIGGYLRGQRQRYLGPTSYLLFGAAVLLLSYELYESAVQEWIRGRLDAGDSSGSPLFTPEQARRYTDAWLSVARQPTATALAMCIPLAACVRLFFRRSGINFAEAFVFSMFVSAHGMVLTGLLTVLAWSVSLGPGALGWLSMLPAVWVAGHAAVGLFGRPASSLPKAVLAHALSFATWALLAGGAIILYVLSTP